MAQSADTRSAVKAYEKCLKLLQDDHTLSLFPYSVPDVPLQLVREQHMLHIDALIGVCMQDHDPRTTQCVPRLRKYVDGAQRDAYRYYRAHYDLAEALLLPAQMKLETNSEPGKEGQAKELSDVVTQVDEIINRAEKYKHCHIPVLQPLTEAEYPKIAQTKGILTMMKLGVPLDVIATSARVQETDTNRALKCWGCDNEAHLTCTGCKTARFCWVECQHRTWKQHKKECRALGGGQKKKA
jgi:hypothetical protein